MTTRYEWTKTGLKLTIETSKRALPRPLSSPVVVPDFSRVASPLIQAALETVAASGRKGIRVKSLGVEDLPGAGPWTLYHASFETAPAQIPWVGINLGSITRVDHLVVDPQAGATHRFYLSDGMVSYPVITLVVPNDLLVGGVAVGLAPQTDVTAIQINIADIGDDRKLTDQERPTLRDYWSSMAANYSAVRAAAVAQGGISVSNLDLVWTTVDGYVSPLLLLSGTVGFASRITWRSMTTSLLTEIANIQKQLVGVASSAALGGIKVQPGSGLSVDAAGNLSVATGAGGAISSTGITDSTAVGRSLLTAATAALALTAIGALGTTAQAYDSARLGGLLASSYAQLSGATFAGNILLDTSGGAERDVKTQGTGYHHGLGLNPTFVGLYDWQNSKNIIQYNPTTGNVTVGNGTHYLDFRDGTGWIKCWGDYYVSGTLGAQGALNVAGAAAFAVGANFTGLPSSLPGSIGYHTVNGMIQCGKAGSAYDYMLCTPAGATVMGVPTNTINANFAGEIQHAKGYRQNGNSMLRVEGTGAATPSFSAGVGVEISAYNSTGNILAFNRTTTAYVPLNLSGSIVNFQVGTVTTAYAHANGLATPGNNSYGYGLWGNGFTTFGMGMMDIATGGRMAGETTSDYNTYFIMSGGTNRGWNFKSGSTVVAGVDASGNGRFAAGLFAPKGAFNGFTVGDGSVAGGISCNSIQGTYLRGYVGTSYDFCWINPAGTAYIMTVATGTRDVQYYGALGAGNITGSGVVTGAKVVSTGNLGFQNDTFITNTRSPIWAFGNATAYGLSYYQGTSGSAMSGGDCIGFHFGNVATPKVWLDQAGCVFAATGNFTSGGNWQILNVKQGSAGGGAFINFQTPSTAGIGWDAGAYGSGTDLYVIRHNGSIVQTVDASGNHTLGGALTLAGNGLYFPVNTISNIWGQTNGGLVQIKSDGITANRWARIGVSDAYGNWRGGMTVTDDLGAVFNTYTSSPSYARPSAGQGYLSGFYPNIETGSTTGPIYVIGEAYAPGAMAMGNMYGIGYGYGPGAPVRPTGCIDSGWGMYVAATGAPKVFLGADTGSGYFLGNLTHNGNLNFITTITPPSQGDNRWLWRNGNNLTWRYDGVHDGIIYHSGNIEQSAAALMAVQAASLAPQWVAGLPALPNPQYPAAIWDSTNGRYQGGYVCIISTKAMYQNQGGAWVSVGTDNAIFGQVTAGSVSAASIGASALVADLVMSTRIRTSGSMRSTATPSKPVGVWIDGNAFTTYYMDGTSDPNCHFEVEGSANVGGMKAAVIYNRVTGNVFTQYGAGTLDIDIPEGIVSIEVMLQAAGGNGYNGGGGGGAGRYRKLQITVKPHNRYRITIGAVGSNSTFSWVSFDSTAGFTSDSGFTTITAECGANGTLTSGGNGGGTYWADNGTDVVATIPTGGGFDTNGVGFGSPMLQPEAGWDIAGGAGGGPSSNVATKAGNGGDNGFFKGGRGTSFSSSATCGGGGASAMANGGKGGRLTVVNGVGGTLGSGGGGGLVAGSGGAGIGRAKW